MKQVFLKVDSGEVEIIQIPRPKVTDETVIVETIYSAVSAGTERSLSSFGSKNLIQKAMERPDQVRKVLDKMSTDGVLSAAEAAFKKLKEPMPMGYSAVGRVLECGRNVTKVQKGDHVVMAGQAYHSELNRVNQNLVAKIPEKVREWKPYAFCALGGIALEGIHQAGVVPGETVAVIGMGLLGHILSRILSAYGCDVIGYDIVDKEMDHTNLKAFLRSDHENAVEMTKNLTMGRGVDKVIITASADSNAPMDLAAAIARDRAVICMVGVTRMTLDRRPYYEKELTFTIARSYGPGRYDDNYEQKGIDYPVGHVRFTEGRNLEEFVRLVSDGRLVLEDLVTHVFGIDRAQEAYRMITDHAAKERYIGVLLEYGGNSKKYDSKINWKKHRCVNDSTIKVGLVGAGNFARSVILPTLMETKKYEVIGLATTGGIQAAQIGKPAGFSYLTNDYRDLLEDGRTDLIIISTTHDTHAGMICEALRAEKNVYCEKPLCLTLEELDAIEQAYANSSAELFCGLNRRHSPFIKRVRYDLKTNQIPAVYEYTVNAGLIPDQHWIQQGTVGGGRIIGEACHFIDTIQYLDGSRLCGLHTQFVRSDAYIKKDNCMITLQFESGAAASIVYTSMGSKKYPKEQLRVFSNGLTAVVDNYIKYEKYGNTRHAMVKLKQDKGIKAEYFYIHDVLKSKKKNKAILDAFTASRLLLTSVTNRE